MAFLKKNYNLPKKIEGKNEGKRNLPGLQYLISLKLLQIKQNIQN